VPEPCARSADDPDRIRLGDSSWLLWRAVLLRSAGFSFDDLADAIQPGLEPEAGDEEWQAAIAAGVDRALALARDDRHRMALVWQNPAVLDLVVDRLAPAAQARRNVRRRGAEHALMRYLQRYHTKNESIGFFGPIRWTRIVDQEAMVSAVPGAGIARRQNVYVEDWAVEVLADALASDPRLAPWVPPALAPQAQVVGRLVLRDDHAPIRLSADEAALVGSCDGRRTVTELAGRLGRTGADVERQVADLVARGALSRRLDVPPDLHAERFLADDLRSLVPRDLLPEAEALLADLERCRSVVAGARTTAELRDATSLLTERFSSATGADATRSKTETDRGRTLAVSLAERAVDVALGDSLVVALAPPLALVMDSVRWYAQQAGDAAEEQLRHAYLELSGFYGASNVPLGGFVARLTGPGDWLDPIVDQLGKRWLEVLDLDLGAHRVDLASGDLRPAVQQSFAAPCPSFSAGWHHSPDVMLAARDVDAINRGEVDFVLGEVHAAMVTVDVQRFLDLSDDPECVPRSIARGLRPGETTFVPLHARWPQMPLTGSTYLPPDAPWPTQRYISFGERIGERRPPAAAVRSSDIQVGLVDDRVVATMPGGEQQPLSSVLASFIGYAVVERFALLPRLSHTPRVVIDRLTVARETWQIMAEDWEELTTGPEPQAYRALRRRTAELGLPRHVFWRARARVKPIYLDLESPLLAAVFVRELRRAVKEGDSVTFQEMYPGPDDLWLVDGDGRRYTSELRLTVADDRSRTTGEDASR
jgi:hypothetical protein